MNLSISRRSFIRGTVGAASAAMAGNSALLNTSHASADPTSDQSSPATTPGCSASSLPQSKYEQRYAGPRWHLIFGDYSGVEEFALKELQRVVQRFFPYVVEIRPAAEPLDKDAHHILIGTASNNPHIAEFVKKGALPAPTKPQGYSSACFKSPLNSERKLVAIAGTDSLGVLYGVVDFNKKLAGEPPEDPKDTRQTLDNLADFRAQDAPLIENRGSWSWGYVIYDYRRFIDNMARLKLNRLNFWNDVPPINCKEIIDYAHSRGIKVVLGFSWGWGYDFSALDPASKAARETVKQDVLCQIARYYQHLGMDAIYFQMFTETSDKEVKGQSIAVLARDWTEEISRAVLDRYPDLHIEWGLHASSIVENYKDLSRLDPRITIVWEDAGVVPYSYLPLSTVDTEGFPAMFNSLAATRDYSKKLASLREGNEFAMVAKGFVQIRWGTQFEHHGPFIMGERDAGSIRDASRVRQPRWDFVNSVWLKNYQEALRFYREVRESTSSRMSVLAVIEDGYFEEKIQISVALFAEMIWNPRRNSNEVLELASSPYYKEIG
jgi:hypothetical protein